MRSILNTNDVPRGKIQTGRERFGGSFDLPAAVVCVCMQPPRLRIRRRKPMCLFCESRCIKGGRSRAFCDEVADRYAVTHTGQTAPRRGKNIGGGALQTIFFGTRPRVSHNGSWYIAGIPTNFLCIPDPQADTDASRFPTQKRGPVFVQQRERAARRERTQHARSQQRRRAPACCTSRSAACRSLAAIRQPIFYSRRCGAKGALLGGCKPAPRSEQQQARPRAATRPPCGSAWTSS